MPWHDKAPWERRKEDIEAKKARAAEQAQAKANMEARVEEVRRALKSFDFGGMSVERFLSEVEQITTGGVVKIGEQHKPEVRG